MSQRPGMAGDDLRPRSKAGKRSATKQWIPAPASDSQTVNGTVLGVSLDTSERVEWVYTIMPDGRRIVTGYDILPIFPLPH